MAPQVRGPAFKGETTWAADCWRDQGSPSQPPETPWGMGVPRGEICWDPCVSLRARPFCVCVSVWEMVRTSSWSRAAASGAHMPKCQQLGRLGSRGSCWADGVCEPSCWKQPPCTYAYTHIFPLVDLLPPQPETGAGWGCWCCPCLCDCSVCLGYLSRWQCIHVSIYICGIYMCLLCVCWLGTRVEPCS